MAPECRDARAGHPLSFTVCALGHCLLRLRYGINSSGTLPMPTPKARLSAAVTAAEIARLQRSVKRCTVAVERMKRETEAALKRMQTDIDNLRSKLRN